MGIAIKNGSQNQGEGCMNLEKMSTKGINRIIIGKAINKYPKYLTAFTMYPKLLLNASFYA
tara:strand:- start:275 stop:457 length:183 start_codon:yes stop_codon:yes gene_type:complete